MRPVRFRAHSYICPSRSELAPTRNTADKPETQDGTRAGCVEWVISTSFAIVPVRIFTFIKLGFVLRTKFYCSSSARAKRRGRFVPYVRIASNSYWLPRDHEVPVRACVNKAKHKNIVHVIFAAVLDVCVCVCVRVSVHHTLHVIQHCATSAAQVVTTKGLE